MGDLDRQLADIASAQYSLITLADVAGLGAARQRVATRTGAGRLHRVERGVYAIAGLTPDVDRGLRATMLATRGQVALSHLAAANRLGIPGYRLAPPEVSIERGVRLRRAGLVVHESTDLERCTLVDVGGVPTTDPARTLLDLGRFVGPKRLLRNIEHCRRAGIVSWEDLIGTLVRHARKGRPGIRRMREVIASNSHRVAISDSDFELLVLALLLEHGLPEPDLHHDVFDGERFVAQVDLAYPSRRIAMECDGPVHLEPDVRERDLARQNDLVLVGWTVLRFTPQRYWTKPQSIVAEARDAYRATPPRSCDTPTRQT